MSLNIGDALSTGAEKLTTTAGIQLAVVYIALQFLTALGTNSAIATVETPAGTSGMATPTLALPIGVAGGAALATLGGILNVALTVVVLRAVTHDAAELGSIPAGVADDMLKTWVFLVIALIVQGIAIGLGFVLLIIPGLFLLVSLIFTQVFVAVEGEGPFEALSSSWSLAKGNRFPLFGLGVVLFVISLLASIPTAVVAFVSPMVGTVLNYVVSGFVSIFSIAVLVAAYQQLSGESAATTTETEDDGVERLDDDSGFDYA
ncbi:MULTISPECIES: hypothetical protein [Halolamina]|uniref:DUF7847 domain-containing protein n=1 Tax=Halolamina pelagica TaxID=699431 RepID=A0A1I5SXA5_9EURY|nr:MULTISPECIES: hypothetical protein [Halolamina]NHX36898.1 hypothetical protein [Halolamina sp. R1-12]SFP75281.1 hypothetical protein SAMN05216277_10754 [Halolamina pelagica]